jgi:hypothetical protein
MTRRLTPIRLKEPAEMLASIWTGWVGDMRAGRTCFRDFSPGARRRLTAHQPHWLAYAALLDRRAISAHATVGRRVEKLKGLFVSGKSPLDELEDADETPEAAIAA